MSIKIDLKILLFLLLFCLTSQIDIYILLMIFALIHELGHLFAGLILGFKAQEISITPVGMKIEFTAKCEEYNKKIFKGHTLAIRRAIIALAGPVTNFLIIALTIIITNVFPELRQVQLFNIGNINYQTIIYSNLLIGIFNLIPIYPLDGGRVIKEILHITVGLKKSYTYTHMLSKITIIMLTALASVLILYIHNISIIIILAYLWVLMILEHRGYKYYQNSCNLGKTVIK